MSHLVSLGLVESFTINSRPEHGSCHRPRSPRRQLSRLFTGREDLECGISYFVRYLFILSTCLSGDVSFFFSTSRTSFNFYRVPFPFTPTA